MSRLAEDDEDVLRGLWAKLVVFDLAVSLTHAIAFVWLEFVDLRVVAPTLTARVLTWALGLQLSLGPLRAWWGRVDEPGDAELVELGARLQGLASRFFLVYVGAWLVCQGLWIALAYLGVPSELPIGEAELLAAACLICAHLLSPLLLRPVLEGALEGALARVRQALDRRGLELAPPSRSIPRSVARLCVAVAVLVFVSMAGVANLARVQGVRATSAADQRRRAELSAAQVKAGGAAVTEVEIVELEALPEALFAGARPGAAALATYDVRAGQALAAAPLPDGRWALAVAPVDEDSLTFFVMVAVMLVVGPPIIFIGARAYGEGLARPIEQFNGAAEEFIASGDLAALGRLVPLYDDELSQLSANFNAILDILERLARAAGAVAKGDLTVSIEHPGELHDAFRAMVERLNETVSSLRETSIELASAAGELVVLAQAQDDASQQQAVGVQQISGTVGSLSEVAFELAQAAEVVFSDAEGAVEMSDAMTEQIAGLRSDTASVGDLLGLIDDIAARSDLIALNGSLEATHAGEAGRGFSIVAGEMRRLAERVTGAVEEVRGRVSSIEASGTNTVQTARRSRALAQQTAEAAQLISSLIQRQCADTIEAAAGVGEFASVAVDAARAVSQTRAAAESLGVHARALASSLQTFEVRGGSTRSG